MDNFSSKIIKGHKKVQQLSRKAKLLIKILSTLLLLSFGFLKLHNIPFGHFSDIVSIQIIFHLILAIYFFSWVLGTNFDIEQQEYVYIDVPYEDKLPWHAIAVSIILVVVFAILCIVNSIEYFTIVLSIFWFMNNLSWNYLVKYFELTSYKNSKDIYIRTQEMIDLEMLEAVYYYIAGPWQKIRFIIGYVLLIILNCLVFTTIRSQISLLFNVKLDQFILVITVAAIILVLEGWIWYERLKVKIIKEHLKMLQKRYILQQKK